MDIKRVLLINSNTCSLTKIYPISLDYLASVLADNDYKVDTLDLAFMSPPEALKIIREKLRLNQYLAIGVGIRNLNDEQSGGKNYLPGIIDFIKDIKKLTDKTEIKIILGGPGFSLMPRTILDETGADYGITGEGESAFATLLDNIYEYKMPKQDLLFEAADIVNISYRRGSWGNFHGYFRNLASGNLQTKRGCPMNCLYCEYPVIEGRNLRLRKPEITAGEFLQLEKLGFPRIYIVDATFNNPLYHAKEVLRAFKKVKTKKPWTGFLNPKFIDQELIDLIRQTNGEIPIKITIESGSDKILRNLNKNFSKADIEKTVKLCRKNKIDFSFTVLFGSPGENRDTVRETCSLIKESKPSHVSMSIGVFIHPKTPIAAKTYKKLWQHEKDFVNPIIYPCDRRKIKNWIEKELSDTGINYSLYEGGEG